MVCVPAEVLVVFASPLAARVIRQRFCRQLLPPQSSSTSSDLLQAKLAVGRRWSGLLRAPL